MNLRTLFKLAALGLAAAVSAAQAGSVGGPLELLVPYQLTQLDPAVKQARIRCDVYAQAIAPAYGGASLANATAGIPVSGPTASGNAMVKINVPQQITVKSYRCAIHLFDGKTWAAAASGGNLAWAKAGPGSVLNVKGKVPPRPTLPGIPGAPANPGLLL